MDAPPIQYARTDDGVNIAYWTLGEGPPLLMMTTPTLSHLQLEWEVATLRNFYQGLASRFQLIRFSSRNAGLSDRNVEHLHLDDFVKDVEAVVAACTDGAVGVVAYFGGELAVKYAADYPDRVKALVVIDSSPNSAAFDASIRDALVAMATASNAMFVESVVDFIDPSNSDGEAVRRLLHGSVDAADRPRMLREMFDTWDVADVLSAVLAPALIICSPRPLINVERAAREMASHIPNSRLLIRPFERLTLADSLSDEVASVVVDFINESIGRSSDDLSDAGQRAGLRTILFTDLESSTALTQKLGDEKAQEVLHRHNDAVRAALAAHDGEEVKHTGDGIMASFPSAVGAVQAALQIQRDLAGGEIRVRIGLNAGEPIAEDRDYFGTAVQLAARICDRAEPGQVLVSNVVRELCAGKTFTFDDMGAATLKGFDEPVVLYAVGEGA